MDKRKLAQQVLLRKEVADFIQLNGNDPVKAATQMLRAFASEQDDKGNLADLADAMAAYLQDNQLNELSKLLKAAALKARSEGQEVPPRP